MYTSSFADKPSILLAFTIINKLLTTASYMIVPDIPIITYYIHIISQQIP